MSDNTEKTIDDYMRSADARLLVMPRGGQFAAYLGRVRGTGSTVAAAIADLMATLDRALSK